MEEILQRLLRLAPPWARQLLTLCALAGAAVAGLHSVFAPTINKLLAGIIEPTNITVTNAAFASLCIIGPIWLVFHWVSPNRKSAAPVLRTIDLVEAAMERVNLREPERVTVRRGLIKALADAAKRNVGQGIEPGIVVDAANSEVPGLVETAPSSAGG